MEAWSNIEISPHDPEIIEIDKFETTLGKLPIPVRQIRELITGFEICHFKYQQHLKYIKESILFLKPNIELKVIGSNHIRQGEKAWEKDKTGRSLTGQQYIWATRNWLDVKGEVQDQVSKNLELNQKVSQWLGQKSSEKERLVRLLIARLTWDWKSYEELVSGDENDVLEYQVCRMDICHYTFPENMDSIIQAVGKMKPVEAFAGCGSYNQDIKNFLKKEISELNKNLDSYFNLKNRSNKNEQVKVWLIACLIKTLKEQVGLKTPAHNLLT